MSTLNFIGAVRKAKMSDESGDEAFASADEGSDNDCTFMKSNDVNSSGHGESLVTSLIDASLTKSTKMVKDGQHFIISDEGDSCHPDLPPTACTSSIQEFADAPFQKDINIEVHNQGGALRCHTEVNASADIIRPLIDLGDGFGSEAIGFGEFKEAEKMHSKDNDLDANGFTASVGNAEALDLADDLWPNSRAPDADNPSGLTEVFSSEVRTCDFVDSNRLKMSGGSRIADEVDSWDFDDPWAGSQTPISGVGLTEVEETVSTNAKSQNRIVATNSKKLVDLPSGKETGSRTTLVLLRSKDFAGELIGMHGQDELIYSKREQTKNTDSGSNKANVWDSEDYPWANPQSAKAGSSLTVESGAVVTQSFQREQRGSVENVVSPSWVEEVDAWELKDGPWSSSGTAKPGGRLVLDSRKTRDTVAARKINEDGSGTGMEEDWDRVEDLQVKKPAVNASQELSSAATALVKSVGGGLASFLESFKLSNLSSTLAAFEEKALTRPADSEQQRSSLQLETSKWQRNDDGVGSAADDNEASGGWGAWDLGSLAKSLTSTVENTGLQIIHGGVDVLEQIGRKTFTALKENDPGLIYTKSFLRPASNSQVSKLSQMLREACDQHAAQLSEEPLSSQSEARRGDLASQLESRLALVHMEALELLSSRASARLGTKLARLEAPHNIDNDEEHHHSIRSLTAEGGVLERIWQTLQLKEQERTEVIGECNSVSATILVGAVATLEAVTPGNALLKICEEVRQNCEQFESGLPMKEIFYRAVEALADLTSAILAYLHKLAECLLLGSNRGQFNTGFLDMAEKVASILTAAKSLNETLCSVYAGHLKEAASSKSTKEEIEAEEALTTSRRLVANLFLETGMANGYLDDAAAKYLVPVFQIACLEAFFPESTLTPVSCRPPVSMKAKQR